MQIALRKIVMGTVVGIAILGGLIYGLYRLSDTRVGKAIDVIGEIVDHLYILVFRALFSLALFAWLPPMLAIPIFAVALVLPILMGIGILDSEIFLVAEIIVSIGIFIGFVQIVGFGRALLAIALFVGIQHWRLLLS